VVDKTKGMDTAMIGDALGGIGDIAGAMNRESAIAKAEQGDGGLLSQASRVTSDAVDCPPGMQSDGGGCY
jgi:hypothetical protein